MTTPRPPSATTYPRARWRLLIEAEPHTGAWNMALDEALMQSVAAGAAPPTLRFYQWSPPCLSLGKRQPLDGVALAACHAAGVDVVRRATGGWAILHTDELTYSITAPADDPRASGAVLDAYRKLSAGLIAGLRRLGLPAEMNPVTPGGTFNLSAACFEVPSAYEIVVGECKLMGSAQTRPQGKMLQHGSLPLAGDIARVAQFLAFPTATERQALAEQLRAHATTLGAALGRNVTFAEAAEALAAGFVEALALDLVPGEVTEAERAAADARLGAVAVHG